MPAPADAQKPGGRALPAGLGAASLPPQGVLDGGGGIVHHIRDGLHGLAGFGPFALGGAQSHVCRRAGHHAQSHTLDESLHTIHPPLVRS